MAKKRTLEIDFSEYKGQWVVICNEKVIASDKKLNKLKKDIKACKTTPTIAKIPEEEVMIF